MRPFFYVEAFLAPLVAHHREPSRGKRTSGNLAKTEIGTLRSCWATFSSTARAPLLGMKSKRSNGTCSATQGSALGQYAVGNAFFDGLVVEQDFAESVRW